VPGTDQGCRNVIRHGAMIIDEHCDATVPEISIVTRKAMGGAYLAMSGKPMRTDGSLSFWQGTHREFCSRRRPASTRRTPCPTRRTCGSAPLSSQSVGAVSDEQCCGCVVCGGNVDGYNAQTAVYMSASSVLPHPLCQPDVR
jgi:hypothetical protein